MTTAAAPPRSGEPIVLAMLRKGRGLDYIARASGWPEQALRDLAVRNDIAVVPIDAGATTAGTSMGVTAPAGLRAALPATSPRDGLRERLDKALAHPAKRVQAAARKVEDAIDRLSDALADDEARNATKRRAAAEKQAAKAEVDRLTAALAEAKAKLRKPRAPTQPANPAAASGVNSAQVRAWAKTAGIDCPAVGRVPQHVIDKYEAATGQ